MNRRAAALTAVCAVLTAVLAVAIGASWDPFHTLDRDSVRQLTDFDAGHSSYTSAMRAVSDVLAPNVWHVVGLVLAVLLWQRGHRRAAIWAAVTTAGYIFSPLAKAIVDRHRPVVPQPTGHFSGLSFPSGHAVGVMLGCVVLVVALAVLRGVWSWTVAAAGAVLVLLVGWSRVTLAAHFPTDVFAGWLLGLGWAAAVWVVVPPISSAGSEAPQEQVREK